LIHPEYIYFNPSTIYAGENRDERIHALWPELELGLCDGTAKDEGFTEGKSEGEGEGEGVTNSAAHTWGCDSVKGETPELFTHNSMSPALYSRPDANKRSARMLRACVCCVIPGNVDTYTKLLADIHKASWRDSLK